MGLAFGPSASGEDLPEILRLFGAGMGPVPNPLDSKSGFSPLCHALENPELSRSLATCLREQVQPVPLALTGSGDRDSWSRFQGPQETRRGLMSPIYT